MNPITLIFVSMATVCAGSPVTKSPSLLIEENGQVSSIDVQLEKNGVTSVTTYNEQGTPRKLLVDDPVSSAILTSLKDNALCIVSPELPMNDFNSKPHCLKIGDNIAAMALSVTLTQCDGKVMLPLQPVPCITSVNALHMETIQSSVSRLQRKKRSFLDKIKKAFESVGSAIAGSATDLSRKILDGTSSAKTKLEETGKVVIGKTKNAAAHAKKLGEKIGEGAKTVAAKGIQGAKDLGVNAKDKITDILG